MQRISGLIAYPFMPSEIGHAIRSALEQVRSTDLSVDLSSWEENDIAGHFIIEPVLSRIDEGNVLVADITQLNFNVIFEIGYAIGRCKRIFLIRNSAIKESEDLIREVGIFDTLGYKTYTNSKELAALLQGIAGTTPLVVDNTSLNKRAPVYLVVPRLKTDFEIRIIARVKKARLQFRTFDPEEQGRLAAGDAIDNVAQSLGVITPLLSKNRTEAEIHNFRVPFVAGLAFALGKPLLLLQEGSEPVPLDYRDFVKSFRFPEQVDDYIAEFATEVTEQFQTVSPSVISEPKTFLARMNLGASAAENEFQELGHYYLETDEFRRTLRGEIHVVTGRKGVGKTALFFQVRDRLRQNRRRIVLDLKPEGFQLLKFKERVLDYLEEGAKEHTITAFWEYLLLLEACYKILEKDQFVHMRDQRLYERYRRLADAYFEDEYISEGDFAERMLKLTQRIADDFDASHSNNTNRKNLTSGEITELLYKHNVASLQQQVVDYLGYKDGLWILFDNLDKGWPAHGVTNEDVTTLRCLIEALRKIERQLSRKSIECHGVIFIRNDVYELLVANTSDRGKTVHIALDWTDSELLRELLRRRFIYNNIQGLPSFEEIWRRICVSHIKGEETSQYIIERSLMRPRGLIELLRACRSRAVNLEHSRIEVSDIEEGEKAYSNELLNNIGFEIRDIFPSGADILYEFIEAPVELSGEEIHDILVKVVGNDKAEQLFELLLWYGFLGLVREDQEITYIYQVQYNISIFRALMKKRGSEMARFRINPAFWKALEVHH